MNNIKKYSGNSATICSSKNCITVYGETAKLINQIAISAAVIIAIAAIAKALR